MSRWYRVFGTSGAQLDPQELLRHLSQIGGEVTGKFQVDEHGWFGVELYFRERDLALQLDRYLAFEEGIRAELNAWAAWIEEDGDSPDHVELMEHLIRTVQLFTFQGPSNPADAEETERLCDAICQLLARATDGVYQADQRGFFAPNGVLILVED